MPSKLAFLGGGLLSGIGQGLSETGKAKREAALKKIEQEGALERDEKQLEGRRGLLDASNAAANERLDKNITSREDLASHRVSVQVASFKHRIRPHGGMDRRVLAVLLYDDVGAAVDVEVGGHRSFMSACPSRGSAAWMAPRRTCSSSLSERLSTWKRARI